MSTLRLALSGPEGKLEIFGVKQDRLHFVIGGVQKAATSWLYLCLREHPQVSLPTKKREAEYLGAEGIRTAEEVQNYISRLAVRAGTLRGDVSVDYAVSHEAPDIMAREFPGASAVFILRNPIERMVSAYWWYARKGLLPIVPLEDAINNALCCWQNRGVSTREARPECIAWSDLMERSLYGRLLQRWRQALPPRNLLFIPYDLIEEDPNAVLTIVYDYLGLETFAPKSLWRRPKVTVNSPSLIHLDRVLGRTRVGAKLIDFGNRFLSKAGFARITDINELEEQVLDKTWDVVRPDLDNAKELLKGTAFYEKTWGSTGERSFADEWQPRG